jgi:hypothetical protein
VLLLGMGQGGRALCCAAVLCCCVGCAVWCGASAVLRCAVLCGCVRARQALTCQALTCQGPPGGTTPRPDRNENLRVATGSLPRAHSRSKTGAAHYPAGTGYDRNAVRTANVVRAGSPVYGFDGIG